MKKVVLILLSFVGFSLAAQGNLTVNVSDSSTAAPGVAVFYFDSPASFYPNGYNNPPVIENFDAFAYTNANGAATFSINNVSLNDTVFWATLDCSGTVVWGAGSPTAMLPNISGNLNLFCMPGDCDMLITVDSVASPIIGNIAVVQAYAIREFSYTSLPSTIPSLWTLNATAQSGFTSANYDSITFNMNTISAPYNITFSRVDSICSSISLSFGGSGGSGPSVTCNPFFTADSTIVSGSGYRTWFSNYSTSNGTITNFTWDFGDGTILGASPAGPRTHIYASAGTYAVCLTMTSILGNDTCTTTYCDSVVVGTGSGGGVGPSCQASYLVDTVNSGLFNNQLIIWETSTSNGQITSWSWDFGDGTTINTRYPSHTYASTGVYNVCLTITALDSAGQSCISTYCDSIGFDANGNLVFKTGFTINVIDPATVGLEDQLLDASLSLYPNPSAGDLNLAWDPRLEVEKVSLFTISGSLVKELAVSGDRTELRGLSTGAYLVRVQTAEAVKTLRLIVE